MMRTLEQNSEPTANEPEKAHEQQNLPPLPDDAMIIVPVRNFVLFPGMVMPVTVGRPRSIAAAQQAVREQRQVGILKQRDPEVSEPTALDMHRMGTVANVVRFITDPNGTHHLVCQGDERFQVVEFLSGWPFLVARVLRIPEPATKTPEIEARLLHLRGQAAPRSGGVCCIDGLGRMGIQMPFSSASIAPLLPVSGKVAERTIA